MNTMQATPGSDVHVPEQVEIEEVEISIAKVRRF